MALRGNLRDFSLPDVFQLVAFSQKTGVLRIDRGDAQGSVWFRDGEVFFAQSNWHHEPLGQRLVTASKITDAALVRALELQRSSESAERRLGQILVDEGYISDKVLEAFVQEQIQDTIFDLMRWDEGDFHFEPLAAPAEEDIGLSVSIENIVMEGSRRLEEWNRIKKKVPSMGLVFKMATAPGEGTFEISLKPIEWELLLKIDGTRDVSQLARDTNRTDFEVARILYGLFSAGLLEVAEDEEIERLRAERVTHEERLAALEAEDAAVRTRREEAAQDEAAAAATAPVEPTAPAETPAASEAAPEDAPEPEMPAFLSGEPGSASVEDMAVFEEMVGAVLDSAEVVAAAEEVVEEAPAELVEEEQAAEAVEETAAEGAEPVIEKTGDFETDLRAMGLGELPEELAQPVEEQAAEEVVEEALEEIAEEETLEEIPHEVVEEELAEEAVEEELADEVVEEVAEEAAEEDLEEPVDEIADEALEEPILAEVVIEEPIEEVADEIAEGEVLEEAAEEIIAEELLEQAVEEAVEEEVLEEAADEVAEAAGPEEAVEEVVEEPILDEVAVEELLEEIAEEEVLEEAADEVAEEGVLEEAAEGIIAEELVQQAVEQAVEEAVEEEVPIEAAETTADAVVEPAGVREAESLEGPAPEHGVVADSMADILAAEAVVSDQVAAEAEEADELETVEEGAHGVVADSLADLLMAEAEVAGEEAVPEETATEAVELSDQAGEEAIMADTSVTAGAEDAVVEAAPESTALDDLLTSLGETPEAEADLAETPDTTDAEVEVIEIEEVDLESIEDLTIIEAEEVVAEEPTTGVISTDQFLDDIQVDDADAGLSRGLGDELTALTGAETAQRPQTTVNKIPEPGSQGVVIQADRTVDRTLLERIIEGIEKL